MTDRSAFTFTVFTPTYNRATTLPRVFDSLCRQTFRDFEWLIVDDGSTDETATIVAGWARVAEFPVRYLRQRHGGLHVAKNRGAQEARGALFVQIDSDDACSSVALDRLKRHWDAIRTDQRERFVGVTALCADPDGRVQGTWFPYDVTDSDNLEMRFRYKAKGEKWGFQRTDLLRRFPFPEPSGQAIVPTGTVWAEIARQGYKTRYVNEVLYIYYLGAPDTMTRAIPAAQAGGRMQFHRTILNNDLRWLRRAPLEFLRSATQYARYSWHLGRGVVDQARDLDPGLPRILWVASLPLGQGLYRWDRRSQRRAGPSCAS